MLSALLPGVREFRTPLVTGVLWVGAVWLLGGHRIASSDSARTFAEDYGLTDLLTSVWIGVAALAVYLLGSLLVVRRSPVAWVHPRLWNRFTEFRNLIEDPSVDRSQLRLRQRSGARIWHTLRLPKVYARIVRILYPVAGGRLFRLPWEPEHAMHSWLGDRFREYEAAGAVPLVRSYAPGAVERGFVGFVATHEVEDADSASQDRGEDVPSWRERLIDAFFDEIMSERPAVETRIQMRFGDVYSEIDRLKVEGGLRLSIFWPLLLLTVALGAAWSWWVLPAGVVPALLLSSGLVRLAEATDKTWAVVIAGEIQPPTLEAIRNSAEHDRIEFDPPMAWPAASDHR